MLTNLTKSRKFDLKNETLFYSHIKIVEINNKRMESKPTQVILTEITSQGLRFLSSLALPLSQHVTWRFQLTLREMTFSVEGVLINVNRLDDGNEYEVEWKGGLELGRLVLSFFIQPNPATFQANESYRYFNEYTTVQQQKQFDLLC
ncbi:hypothetical protein [Paenibacillus qinlingensis]|uniref:PilZ domain-containing protein n=1 Tax=Paenibacillus qinlingensis TaxID=1837343 RepID=A0ABU1NXS7_9BACL|nr:hypothetical protein [Paenibacillus qinlingensis]MDR6552313.1 hypothetical protein [Paenibacillus qinlingensis]